MEHLDNELWLSLPRIGYVCPCGKNRHAVMGYVTVCKCGVSSVPVKDILMDEWDVILYTNEDVVGGTDRWLGYRKN